MDPHTDECLRTVAQSWTATYHDPIQLTAGDVIVLSGRRDIWDGHTWLWAINAIGKEGWIPISIVSEGNPARATETYSALELTCHEGQILTVDITLQGWALCSNNTGQKGWVPVRNLSEMNKA